MSSRFAFSLAALERPTSGAAFPGLSPCWSTRLRPPLHGDGWRGGLLHSLPLLWTSRKTAPGRPLHVSLHIGCGCLEIAYDHPEIAYGCLPFGLLNRQIAIGDLVRGIANLAKDIVNLVRP